MKNATSVTELRRQSMKELRTDLQLKRAEVAKIRIGLTMQSEKNSGLHKAKKREVARMSMVLREMESSKKPSQKAKKPVKSPGSKTKKTA